MAAGIADRACDAAVNCAASVLSDDDKEFVQTSCDARPGGLRTIVVMGETRASVGVAGVGAFGSNDAEKGEVGEAKGACSWCTTLSCARSTSSTSVDLESLGSKVVMIHTTSYSR